MPKPAAPAPRTPQFNPYAECSHCGTSAGMCAIHITNQLDAFDAEWKAGEHPAQQVFAGRDAKPELVQLTHDRQRARTEDQARCCAGCTMHGYSR